MFKLIKLVAGAFALTAMLQHPSLAQGSANQPIRVINPMAAGSGPDVLGRRIASEASRLLGQPVVFDNRPGANGRLGLQPMKDAPADGHVLNLLNDGVSISQPAQDADFKFEPGRDYEPVALLFGAPLVLFANPNVPYRDIKGLAAYAKANPGKVNFAITAGSSSQYLAERMARVLDIKVTMVPFKGGAETSTATLGGHTDLFLSTIAQKPQVETGRLLALASSGKERWKPFPNAPTFTESGLPLVFNASYLLVAAAGTPRDKVLALHKAFDNATRSPELSKHMDEQGFIPFSAMPPDEVASFIRSEIKVWTPILRTPQAMAK